MHRRGARPHRWRFAGRRPWSGAAPLPTPHCDMIACSRAVSRQAQRSRRREWWSARAGSASRTRRSSNSASAPPQLAAVVAVVGAVLEEAAGAEEDTVELATGARRWRRCRPVGGVRLAPKTWRRIGSRSTPGVGLRWTAQGPHGATVRHRSCGLAPRRRNQMGLALCGVGECRRRGMARIGMAHLGDARGATRSKRACGVYDGLRAHSRRGRRYFEGRARRGQGTAARPTKHGSQVGVRGAQRQVEQPRQRGRTAGAAGVWSRAEACHEHSRARS